jgi:polysaccharide deacetylase 2 family uncharacterized protein YibQ
LGTDLNAPLGQNRKARPPRSQNSVFTFGRVLLGVGLAALIGVSAWTVLRPTGLIEPTPAAETMADAAQPAKKPESDTTADGRKLKTSQTSGALSGAHVEETLTDDGSIVTKFSPKQRDGDGPAFVEVGRTKGQDPRMAAFPNDVLLEDAPEGRLPVTGPDGLRPMDQYARPWSGARGTRIALVVGGLGLSQTGTQNALRQLPPEITMAFAATGNSLQRWMQEARRGGHEILLQVPLEPFDYPANDPGPETLLTSKPVARNIENLHKAMGEITNYTGIMNYLGGRFLSDPAAMEPVMRDIGKRGLLFLDDGTSAQSKTATVAKGTELPYAFADLQLDGQVDISAILKKLDELERIARKNGQAIGIASAFDESVDAIAKWSEEASMRGIEIVGVAALSNDPRSP